MLIDSHCHLDYYEPERRAEVIKSFKEEIIKEENFKKLTLQEQKKMFLTMLDLNQMYVNESEISDKKYEISAEDQKLTKAFYSKK